LKRVAVVGPTGSGKTALGIELALRVGGEVISCDSRQVFLEMDIGTAKPSRTQRNAVRHWMLDVLQPTRLFSAGEFAAQARDALQALPQRGPAWLVGGSGFYLKALLDGIDLRRHYPPPEPALRRRLETEIGLLGQGFAYEQLRRLNAERALSVHPNDRYRIVRSLEAVLVSGGAFAAASKGQNPQDAEEPACLILGLRPEKEWLTRRLRTRAEGMLKEGLLEEVRRLKERGFHRFPPFCLTTGYPEALSVVQGERTLVWLIEAMVLAHLRLAKKQMTFLRHKIPGIVWVNAKEPLPDAREHVRHFLEG
jgi:tRNA dimethylallyltransferase